MEILWSRCPKAGRERRGVNWVNSPCGLLLVTRENGAAEEVLTVPRRTKGWQEGDVPSPTSTYP